MITVSKINEVVLKLELTLEQSLELFEYFKCYVPGYFFNKKYKNKIWDGTVSLFNRQQQSLPIGLLKYLLDFFQQFKYEYKLDFNNNIEPISDTEITDIFNEFVKKDNIQRRDYQDNSIKLILEHKKGLVENCVGSGKSLVIYLFTRFIIKNYPNKKILIIVPTINLVEQLFSDFSNDYGWTDCKKYANILYNKTAKLYDKKKNILISTYQSLVKKSPEFFEDFIAVVCDEAQTAKSLSIKTILQNCINAEYRIGTSGTLPKERLDLMTIIGYLGPKLCAVKIKEMQDKNVLSQIKIVNLFLKYPPSEFSKLIAKTKIHVSCSCGLYTDDYYLNQKDGKINDCPECGEKLRKKSKIDYTDEIKIIEQCKDRNKIFKYIIKNGTDDTQNILILVDHLEHLKSIKEYVEREFIDRDVIVINGSVDADVREDMRQQMINDGGFILIATYKTVQLGINIPRLHHVIFGSSGSSEIKIIQSIGRGLRTHESKDKLILWDIVDDLRFEKKSGKVYENYTFLQHLNRLEYYKEQEFSCINKEVNLEKI